MGNGDDRNYTIDKLFEKLRVLYGNERDKGTGFEEFIKKYLLIEPRYSSFIDEVWLWKKFPYTDDKRDLGIDLVARTVDGEFWAIQCKFYEKENVVSKADVDTFLATSSKLFNVDGEMKGYSCRFIISTTDKYNKNAEKTLINQNPPVIRIGMTDLIESEIDWSGFLEKDKLELKEKYKPLPHQRKAIDDVLNGFKISDRGKLIMACGTGKTFTSLRIMEEVLNGKGTVLFLVPSIALINQTMSEWTAQCNYSYDTVVVCSDNKAGKGENSIDLGIPSTTDVKRLYKHITNDINKSKNLHFIFSTYQSIDVISKLQKECKFQFDLIICDEAHRTTGVTLGDSEESHFVKVHDNEFINSKKRLYMTATPRVFGDKVKSKVKDANAELCSMDDKNKYGPVFHNLTFSDAVKQDLLTDYKVLVLAIDEKYVEVELQKLLTDENHEMKLNDSVKIMGCWNGLSKNTLNNDNESFKLDSSPMKRAVAFCNRIKDSKKVVDMFNIIQEHIKENNLEEAKKLVNVEIEHVDGTFNALEKKEKINWLKEDCEENTCRILTNARCLSEGIDVPALDAAIFLNPRSSMIDIIQSVGRVMRKSPGKKYGYVMLPIGIPLNEKPEEALDKNDNYKIVWSVLQALRAHDNRFDNIINKIDLNKSKPNQINIVGIGGNDGRDKEDKTLTNPDTQLEFNLNNIEKWQDYIFAKIVKKVGSRVYWEMWAKDVAEIARAYVRRINIMLDNPEIKIEKTFNDFIKGLKQNINSSISKEDAIEMLAQHMITKPVFDALFEGYEFINNNPVSKTMQKMINLLHNKDIDTEKITLEKFYSNVRDKAKGIDNFEGKQKIIIELYEKFFKVALPKEVEKLGIVYTPTECVDFIINSVEELLKKEFGKSLSDKGVHIIDGFTGTGTFIVRLLQSGLINPNEMIYKYTNEIHANEIVLLAYYIATINIEEAFHHVMKLDKYIPFNGVVLTDTFQLYEDWTEDKFAKAIFEEVSPANSERAKKQRDLPITVCIGNPPYSIGEKSENDNAKNLKYPKLDKDINNTYSEKSETSSKRSLYDSYIRAFRWASNRIASNGIIGFITNGSYIDGRGMDGFRKCLIDEFTSIYVFNLRGNQRTSGEDSRKEGGKIFGSGSRTQVAITCLIKNNQKNRDGYIHYYDIGDYLKREEKLDIIKNKRSIENIEWKEIYPDVNNDWINKRNQNYSKFISINPEKKGKLESKTFFTNYGVNPVSSRDSWVYSFSREKVKRNVESIIKTYNKTVKEKISIEDKTKISWSRGLKKRASNNIEINFEGKNILISQYRPFCKEYVYYSKELFENPGKMEEFISEENLYLCVLGGGSTKEFSCLVTRNMPDFQILFNSRCLPLYWYKEKEEANLISSNERKREDGISNYILKKCKNKYKGKEISKEDIFYYVYGLLHSKDYRNEFKADLQKSLPKLFLTEEHEDFKRFSDAGRELSKLHLNYENIEIYEDCKIICYKENYAVEKMKFGKNGKKTIKSTIVYNKDITITDIPEKAYEYVVNGKSAIEWIMDRYAVTIDKKSGIKNNPNDWCKEVGDDKYIFNLLLRVINVSLKTVDIVENLPELKFK